MKIGYFGDGPWAHNALKKIIADNDFKIAFVVPRYDKQDPVLKKISEEHNIDFILSKNINSDEFIDKISRYDCDIFVSMSFNQIFKEKIINCPRNKVINCHAGKLPFYRGRNILNWVLINDENEFGITVHQVDTGIDTGPIVNQKCYRIDDEDDYKTLLEKAYIECGEVLFNSLQQYKDGTHRLIEQKTIHPTGFYCGIRGPGDEIIDWHQTSREIFNFVRALVEPGPVAITFCGEREIYIHRAEEIVDCPMYKGIPGQVIGSVGKKRIIKTLDRAVLVTYSSDKNLRIGDRLQAEKNI